MTVSLIVEVALSLLLVATLVYCALLERRLAALRKGQDGLKDIIADLNGAITHAGTSMRMLKSTAAGTAETLDERVSRARSLIDELSLLTASGERIASRIERNSSGPDRKIAADVFPAAAGRLDPARPQFAHPDKLNADKLRNVR